MVEKVVKAGYEEIYETAVVKLDSIEEEVRREVEQRIAKDKEALTTIIESCLEEVEVPDEPVEEIGEEANIEENIENAGE